MQQKLIIGGSLPSLNEYIKAINSSRFTGNTLKQSSDDLVIYECKKQKLKYIEPACFIEFHWYCKDKKQDKDNIAFAKKFILDGLQKARILRQDNWGTVEGFRDFFIIDKDTPRIEVFLLY